MICKTLFEQYFESRPEFFKLDLSLSRINDAARDAIGAVNTKTVHIAGTNGKGSTAYFIAQILESEGYSTLLFTSPHIMSICERIQLGLKPVSLEEFEMLFVRSKVYIEKYNLTYFEAVFFMALLLNKEAKPDYLILETGMGGRFDATNTDAVPVKTPVLASFSQDHKEYLGKKIADIISEKTAIVKDNNPVFMGDNPAFIVEICRKQLPGKDIRLPDLSRLEEARELYPDPYSINYLNAHNVCEFLLQTTLGLKKLALPMCRQERFGRVMLDGAHNVGGMISLLRSFGGNYPEAVILSSTEDRNIEKLHLLLEDKIPNIINTTIPDNPRGINPKRLEKLPYKFIAAPEEALEYALENFEGEILVTGSLYLCAYLRQRLAEG